MSNIIIFLIVFAIAPVPIGFIIEALRKRPQKPEKLYWSDNIDIQYINVNGNQVRYIKTGTGPVLVLLHTLRSQLDLFQRVIPELAKNHTVYALDYPGHGFSDIPETDYTPDFFVESVEGFLNELDISDATLAGISIGGVIPLLMAARKNQRVKAVVSINPYDFYKGLGVTRANPVAWMIIHAMRVPFLGETVMRMRLKFIEDIIWGGGVIDKSSWPRELLESLYASGCRSGQYQGFINLVRHGNLWEEAHREYQNIDVLVLLVYGKEDWSNETERNKTISGIPNARSIVLENSGHFSSVDAPEEIIDAINSITRV